MSPTASPAADKRVDPPYDAEWTIDLDQAPEAVLDRHRRNSASPAAHAAFERVIRDKVDRFGVIHVDPATGYRARFHPREAAAAAPRGRSRSGTGD